MNFCHKHLTPLHRTSLACPVSFALLTACGGEEAAQ